MARVSGRATICMVGKGFVDTNGLIYAFDLRAGEKRDAAAAV
jgi:predicted nucleic acid-binding protein